MPEFGRMFLKLKYTDITKKRLYAKLNGYGDNGERKVWSSCGSHVLYLVRVTYYSYTAHVRPSVYIRLKRVHAETAHVKCLEP